MFNRKDKQVGLYSKCTVHEVPEMVHTVYHFVTKKTLKYDAFLKPGEQGVGGGGGGGGVQSAAQRHSNIMNMFQTHSELLTNFTGRNCISPVRWHNPHVQCNVQTTFTHSTGEQ